VGLRFQKRKTLIPGVRLNVGKRGPSSVRFGGRGAGVSVGKRGFTASLSAFGTGLSYIFRSKRR
jgi:hypothetical protein